MDFFRSTLPDACGIVAAVAVRTGLTTRDRPAETLPLENGDRLTRREFERRYAARPDLKKAELIDNDVQPDAMLSIDPDAGGRSRLSDDDYVEGAQELIVEIAASSAAIDLHDKLRAYRRNGVQEYLVWRVLERELDWFVLSDDEYRPLSPGATGVLESRVFPGLRLAVGALLPGDLAGVLSELQNGVRTPEHAAFVERLRSAGDTVRHPRNR